MQFATDVTAKNKINSIVWTPAIELRTRESSRGDTVSRCRWPLQRMFVEPWIQLLDKAPQGSRPCLSRRVPQEIGRQNGIDDGIEILRPPRPSASHTSDLR